MNIPQLNYSRELDWECDDDEKDNDDEDDDDFTGGSRI